MESHNTNSIGDDKSGLLAMVPNMNSENTSYVENQNESGIDENKIVMPANELPGNSHDKQLVHEEEVDKVDSSGKPKIISVQIISPSTSADTVSILHRNCVLSNC